MKVPLLVVHGTADPVFPLAHGEALARSVADAKFMKVEGGSHEIHDRNIEDTVNAIADHTAS